MALRRVTLQDIADACGLSRNTVSKVFNDRGAVQEATRQIVLKKAQELGYVQLPEEMPALPAVGGKSVALLTQRKLLSHNFGAYFITSFTNQISRAGYTLQIYEISPEETARKDLPPQLNLEDTAGFLCMELFDRDYQAALCALQKPTVFVDGFPRTNLTAMTCDRISMENVSSEFALVGRMIAAGARRIGFVGDREHCNSFFERWLGFWSALTEAGLQPDESLCILAEDGDCYSDTDWLIAQMEAMPTLPDAFACANDFLAIHLMTALKKKGLRIPEDVMVTGFDGSPEAAVIEPRLTTAQIPGAEIGQRAAAMLIERIHQPDAPYFMTYVNTTPIWGGSTR